MTKNLSAYYRSGKGSHKHTTFYCANKHRSFSTGDPFRIPADEVDAWIPCAECCTPEEVAKAEAAAKVVAAEFCKNSGVEMPHRIYSKCSDCGKEGKVTNGALRKHKPQA